MGEGMSYQLVNNVVIIYVAIMSTYIIGQAGPRMKDMVRLCLYIYIHVLYVVGLFLFRGHETLQSLCINRLKELRFCKIVQMILQKSWLCGALYLYV